MYYEGTTILLCIMKEQLYCYLYIMKEQLYCYVLGRNNYGISPIKCTAKDGSW